MADLRFDHMTEQQLFTLTTGDTAPVSHCLLQLSLEHHEPRIPTETGSVKRLFILLACDAQIWINLHLRKCYWEQWDGILC